MELAYFSGHTVKESNLMKWRPNIQSRVAINVSKRDRVLHKMCILCVTKLNLVYHFRDNYSKPPTVWNCCTCVCECARVRMCVHFIYGETIVISCFRFITFILLCICAVLFCLLQSPCRTNGMISCRFFVCRMESIFSVQHIDTKSNED